MFSHVTTILHYHFVWIVFFLPVICQRIPIVPIVGRGRDEPVVSSEEISSTPPIVDTTNSTEQPLTLKACCGDNCVTFETLMSMVGVQCCGDTPVNFFDKICCNNAQFYDRRSGSKYYDRCCGEKPYTYDQTCCKGKIYDGGSQTCCGEHPYHTYDRTIICCTEHLHRVPDNSSSPACCGDTVYDAWGKTQFCCGGKVYRRNANHACCLKHEKGDASHPSQADGYNPQRQLCCDGVHDLKTYDTCCYVSDTKVKEWTPPKPIPYNSTSQCCDFSGVKEFDQQTGVCKSK